jgi:hypothetical protein
LRSSQVGADLLHRWAQEGDATQLRLMCSSVDPGGAGCEPPQHAGSPNSQGKAVEQIAPGANGQVLHPPSCQRPDGGMTNFGTKHHHRTRRPLDQLYTLVLWGDDRAHASPSMCSLHRVAPSSVVGPNRPMTGQVAESPDCLLNAVRLCCTATGSCHQVAACLAPTRGRNSGWSSIAPPG